ncbi:mechanosensitive ion channel domain-containing protein [Pontiella sulfatireligans]|uniref:Mechanosensitive channel MscK n=1 Tax=Pontiella sulfatireligans TaxID=2750658 RepID=A0A6C2UHX2_9BACT|nr:mechanosensitive ion channel domain-containing protein [Pontiella sulfatireligans]VGO19790.1 Mechanosensitive channel MscK [Pontiella sulfatireligans]
MKFLTFLLALQLLCITAGAQTNATPSAAEVKELTASVQNDGTIEDIRRQALLKQLEQVDAFLASATQLEEKTAKMARDLQQASSVIEAIQKELLIPEEPLVISSVEAADLTGLEKRMLQSEAKANEAGRRLEKLDAENNALSTQRTKLPELLAGANTRQSELEQTPAIPPEAEGMLPKEARLNQWLISTELRAVSAEAGFYQLELTNYDTLKALQTARIDQATRHVGIAQTQTAALSKAVDRQRRIESEEEATRADQARLEASLHHPEIQAVAERNAELAALRAGEDGLSARQRIAAADLQQARKLTLSTQERSKEIEERIDAAGLTHAVAQLLSRERSSLPDLSHHKPRARVRKREIALVQLSLLDFSDQREELRDIAGSVKRRMDAIGEAPAQEHIRPLLTEYLTAQRKQLDTLISEYNAYFNLLIDLDTAERQLVDSVHVLSDDISEHILWIRSDSAIGLDSPRFFAQGVASIAKRSIWQELAHTLQANFQRNPYPPVLLLISELALIVASIGAKRRLKKIADLVVKIHTDCFFYTIEALFYTALRALPLPLPLFYLAWRIGTVEAPPFSSAVGNACYLTGLFMYCFALLLQAILPDGLVEAHFGADKTVLERFRWRLVRLMAILLPIFWLIALLHFATETAELGRSLARLCYIILQLVIARFAYSIFCRRSKIMEHLIENEQALLLVRFRVLAFYVAVGIPLVIITATLIGYYFTALAMSKWFVQTLGLVFALALVEALLIRWIQVVARKAELERRLRERREHQQQREAGETELPTEPVPAENDEMNFVTLNESTRKLISIIFAFALLFGLWFIWSDAFPALGVFNRIVLWNVFDDTAAAGAGATIAISLADLTASVIVIMLTVAGARHLPSLVELAVLRQLRIDYGTRYAISTIIRYITVAVGLSIALSMLGIGWSKFKWLAAALSVGLGFGLQEIFANFISGLILLFERPIRVCDYVTVNGTSGQVSRIQIRATTITDWDNKELLIPNKQFVTGELVNWTLTNSILRIVIPVGVAYGSDTKKVESTLLSVASSYRLSVHDPEPNAFFTGFGDSSLNFELRVYIANAENFRLAKHELNMAVDAAFHKAGIVIAFPQLDVHMQPQAPAMPEKV